MAGGGAQAPQRHRLATIEVRREDDERAVCAERLRRHVAEEAERQLDEVDVRPGVRACAVRQRQREPSPGVEVDRRVGGGRDLLDVVGDAVAVVVVERGRVRAAGDPVDDDVLAGEGQRRRPVRELAAVRRPLLQSGLGTRGAAEEGDDEGCGERGAQMHAGRTWCGSSGYAVVTAARAALGSPLERGTRMSILIKGGRVITAADDYVGDVYVEDERISLIGESLDLQADRVIDAAGKYVLPGCVDPHTHLDMPFGGTITIDDFESGHVSAAFGGTTCHVDFVHPVARARPSPTRSRPGTASARARR